MVRAILADRKSQTRRVMKPQPPAEATFAGQMRCSDPKHDGSFWWCSGDERDIDTWGSVEGTEPFFCPYGDIGDRLWVKETHIRRENRAIYFADLDPVEAAGMGGMYGGWKPSIFMFRKHSRITLEITDVRAERLQDINDDDVLAEGIQEINVIVGAHCAGGIHREITADRYFWDGGDEDGYETAADAYQALWNKINLPPNPIEERGVDGKRRIVGYISYPWSDEDFDAKYPGAREAGIYRGKPLTVIANPWVWVPTFNRVNTGEAF
jgi:hypothetical protein